MSRLLYNKYLAQKPLHQLVVGVAILCALPLITLRYLPMVDGPQHEAILDICVRLFRGEKPISDYYALTFQHLSSFVFYGIAGLFALWVPSFVAIRILVVISYVLMFVSLCWGHGELSRLIATPKTKASNRSTSIILGLAAIPVFYGHLFLWGFLPNLLGLALASVALSVLAVGLYHDGPERWRLLATVSLLATLCSSVLWPSLVVMAGAALINSPRRWRGPFAAGAVSTVLVAPGMIRWAEQKARVGPNEVRYIDLKMAFLYGQNFFRNPDSILYTRGQYLLLMLALAFVAAEAVMIFKRWRQAASSVSLVSWMGLIPPHVRMLGLVALAAMPMSTMIPFWASNKAGGGFGINFRHLPVALLALCLLAGQSPLFSRAIKSMVCVCLITSAALCSFGVSSMASELTRQIGSWPQGLIKNKSGRMASAAQQLTLGGPGFPYRSHCQLFAVPEHLAWAGGLFLGDHLPVKTRQPEAEEHRQWLSQRLVEQLRFGKDEVPQEVLQKFWRQLDYIWVQQPDLDRWLANSYRAAEVLARGPDWAVLGPPASYLDAGDKTR